MTVPVVNEHLQRIKYYAAFLMLIRATHTNIELDQARVLESFMLPPDPDRMPWRVDIRQAAMREVECGRCISNLTCCAKTCRCPDKYIDIVRWAE